MPGRLQLLELGYHTYRRAFNSDKVGGPGVKVHLVVVLNKMISLVTTS